MPNRRAWRTRLATTYGGHLAVVVFSAILIATTWIALFGVLRVEREQTIRAAVSRNDGVAIAFEHYVLRTIESADSVIRYVIREYTRGAERNDLARFVAAYTIDNKSFVGLVLADEQGNAFTTAYAEKPVAWINVFDREHFKVHMGQDTGKVFVGKPVIGRITGKPIIPITRRINKADGTFGGVAMALIEPARFTDVLQDTRLRALDIISLVGVDGITRARLKGPLPTWGQDVTGSPLLAQSATRPVGNLLRPGQVDGVTRFFSYRKLADYRLVVLVGTAESDVMERFNSRQTMYFKAAGLTSAVIAGFAALLMLMLASRQRAAVKVVRSQARVLATFDQAAVGIADLTLQGRYVDVNHKLCNILGYSKGELCERTLAEVTYPDDIASTSDLITRLIAEPAGTSSPEREKRYIRKDGAIVWCSLTISLVRDSSGNPEYLAVVIQDISDRKRAETELQETESRFRTIFEQAGIGMAMVDAKSGRILRCNPALARMLGYSEGEMLGLSVEAVSEPEGFEQERELWEGLVDGAHSRYRLDKRYRRKDGGLLWGRLTATVVRDSESKALFLIGMLEDVTEMKASQEEVIRLAHRLTTTIESITDAFFTLDHEWRFTYVNQAAEILLQGKCGPLLGQIVWDACDDSVVAIFKHEFQSAMHTMRMVEFERHYPALGKWLEARAYPSEEGLAIYLKDITARKDAESVIAYMAALVESSSEAIVSNDLDGVIVSWNRGAERTFGYTASEIVGRRVGRLLPADLRHENAHILGAIKRGHSVDRFETVRSAKDGTRIDVSVSVSPIKSAAGDVLGASVVAHDITERKKAEAAARGYSLHLQRLSRRLMEVEEEERRRLGSELHDRTGSNLSALLLSLAVLRRKLPFGSPPEVAQRLDDSETLLRETMVHMRDVLAELRPPALDELGLFAALTHHAHVLGRRSGLEISAEGREPSPRVSPGNEIALFRIAQEALNNAARHAAATRITVSLAPGRAHLTLIIADNGKGFDSTLPRPGSSSLGLVIMRERAEAMSGQFTLETSIGGGTCITVVIPHENAGPATVADRTRPTRHEGSS